MRFLTAAASSVRIGGRGWEGVGNGSGKGFGEGCFRLESGGVIVRGTMEISYFISILIYKKFLVESEQLIFK